MTFGRLDLAAPVGMMSRMIPTRTLALAVAIFAAGQAQAQAPRPDPVLAADRMQMATCLRQSASATGSCIGLIAVTCVRAATGDRRDAEIGCARREEAVWRERLGIVGQALMRAIDSGTRGQFASLQIAWEGYVAQKCAFYGNAQPPARVAGMQAGCELREVANRSLELERMVGQQRGAARRPSSPPQIIR